MPGEYTKAFYKDVDKLLADVKTVTKALKAKPNDKKLTDKLTELRRYTPDYVEKLRKRAAELDANALKKTLKSEGFWN